MSIRRAHAVCAVWLLLSLLLQLACGIEQKRSGLPAGAQSAIDDITSDMTRGDHEKIYADAAEEWRRTSKPEESRAHLERVRKTLGSVISREQVGAQQREGGNTTEGHTLVVSYNTKFERADAIETFTLVEREGRWRLARYAVNSNALRQ